jgi:hypothetical protein
MVRVFGVGLDDDGHFLLAPIDRRADLVDNVIKKLRDGDVYYNSDTSVDYRSLSHKAWVEYLYMFEQLFEIVTVEEEVQR